MDTPPPPKFTFNKTCAKTPFQHPISRNARSECQPKPARIERANKSTFDPDDIRNRLASVVKSTTKHHAVGSNFSCNKSAPQTILNQHFPPTVQKPDFVSTTNRYRPVATATKAPLSVSQNTQPTPSSSKATHTVCRAQSEPSIKYQVKVNDVTYKVLRKIGSGGSAKVYEGFEPNTYRSVAIKIINVANADSITKQSYFNENSILKQLKNSKHVVKIYNSEYKAECKELVIVMEKGDADLAQVLDFYFRSRQQTHIIDGLFVKFYWRGMLQAVNEIHQNGIVHADLKPVNFILVKNQIKLIDFGIASLVEPDVTSVIRDYQIGTINYMAPEALENRASDTSSVCDRNENNPLNPKTPMAARSTTKKTLIKYNSKVDIWSLGCILYNFVYGRPPFDKYPDLVSKVQAITNPRHIIDFPVINNIHLMSCMKMCLKYNPRDRPTAEELLSHPYLKDDIVILDRKQ